MREKLLAIGDDFWIENDRGEHATRSTARPSAFRKTFVLETRPATRWRGSRSAS